jgi:hypothetical protein
VYARGIESLNIYSNQFHLSRLAYSSYNQIYGGVYLDYCTAYHIEGNSFSDLGPAGPGDTKIGITINNSGEAFNQINNNTFTNLYIGTLAQNNNYSSFELAGLKILCNDYSENESDCCYRL